MYKYTLGEDKYTLGEARLVSETTKKAGGGGSRVTTLTKKALKACAHWLANDTTNDCRRSA